MSAVQLGNVVTTLHARCAQNIQQGGNGFVSTDVLRYDVGLRTTTIRKVMDEGVRTGSIEREAVKRSDGRPGSYLYRVITDCT